MKKFLFFGLASAIALLGLAPREAAAIPYNGQNVYKVISNGNTIVYISGTPSGTASVALGFIDRFSSRVSGSCGEIRLTSTTVGTTPTIQVAGSSVTLASLPTQLLPSCTNGTFAESRPDNFKTPAGDVIVVGQTPGTAILLNIPRNTNRTVRINACGFGTLRNSSSFSIPANFSVDGSNVSLATLESPSHPPVCRTGVGYKPASWGS